jgi:all-trans-retinol 13,14-reductase
MAEFDFVIIGSGLGGLETACILAKNGYKVCILEKNRQFGGTLQIFSQNKVIFDAGVHYIGGLGKGQVLHRLFSYLEIADQLKLKQLDVDGFDHIQLGNHDQPYKIPQGKERFLETMTAYFPTEKKAIQTYWEDLQKVAEQTPFYNVFIEPKDFELSPFHTQSIGAYLDELTNNSTLKKVLAGNNLLYAGKAAKTPFYVHAIVEFAYLESAWKCVDGGAQIATLLLAKLKEWGGEARNYAEVGSILTQNGQIQGVQLLDGEQISCSKIVANIHPEKLFDLVEPGLMRPAYVNRIKNLQNATSAFTLNIVLKPDSLPAFNHNIYYHSQAEVWTSEYAPENWPSTLAVFCPASSQNQTFADSLSVMTYMDWKEVEPWAETERIIPQKRGSRGESYERFKEEKSKKVLAELEKLLPGIHQHILHYSAQTPLTYRDYLGTPKGSIYGISMDANEAMKYIFSSKQRVENLYLTGQNLNLHGIVGVSVSAIVTCSEILGRSNFLNQLRKA